MGIKQDLAKAARGGFTAADMNRLRAMVKENVGAVKPHRIGHFVKEGFAWNPLKSWPRNEACFCLSGKKFKKCCGPNLRECVAVDEAPKLQSLVDQMKLIKDIKKGKI